MKHHNIYVSDMKSINKLTFTVVNNQAIQFII